VPASLKLQEELGDAVQVIFVESQGATRDKAEAFALRQKWLGGRAMWTDERPVDSQSNGLPSFVLIGIDGEVLLRGNPLAMKGDIEDTIAREIERSRAAPEGTPTKLKKAWSEYGKGNYAGALAEAEKVATESGDDAELASHAKQAADAFQKRVGSEVARVKAMLASGEYLAAEELLAALEKGTRAHETLAATVAEVRQELSSETLATEREAADALAKLEEKMYGKGKLDKHLSSLEKLAEKYAGTKAGSRAKRILTLLEMES
jgi:hypothetical protein